uniref:Putative transcription activator n=1 Tax=Trypanosoma congolense (strain IL3000) TaxID=1068625 RepID=G0UJZ4_TRYCI|nr:putative transcription activator [Trypanosoma congolense IL3000]
MSSDLSNPSATLLGGRHTGVAGVKRSRPSGEPPLDGGVDSPPLGGLLSVRTSLNVAGVEVGNARAATTAKVDRTVEYPTHCGGRDEDEDEEELRLLLGDGASVPCRRPQSSMAETGCDSRRHDGLGRATTAEVCEDGVGVGKEVDIGDLPWETVSNSCRKELAERFEAQVLWKLSREKSLLQVFEPFFTERTILRIQEEPQSSQFLPVKEMTPGLTDASGGYTLRPYQVEGVQFMLNRFHSGMSCILADEMGLGKTAQVASFLNVLKKLYNIDGPHLIVVPFCTLGSWSRELARWAPTLKVLMYHSNAGGRSALRRDKENKHCVFVTTPTLFKQDRSFFRKRTWVVAVMDEAHILKGKETMVFCVSRKITACFRIAVTGTPVHNSVHEVWNIIMFLYPAFCALYNSSGGDPASAAEDCAKLLQHVMLRRTKSAIELGIPPRVEEPVAMVKPTRMQWVLLSRMSVEALKEGSGKFLQNHLVHQRIVCSHPLALRITFTDNYCPNTTWESRMAASGIPLNEKFIVAPSAKMIELDRMLPKLKEQGHRCLIFSNFTSVLDLLQGFCSLRGYSFERIDGSVPRVARELSMVRFNSPNSKVFLCLLSLAAGGVGITLTGADTVIFFDTHYNPQLERQAADRAHRIGQTRTVRVMRLCCQNTVEERIHDVAAQKLILGDFIVDNGPANGEQACGGLSAKGIRQLLTNPLNEDSTPAFGVAADGSCIHKERGHCSEESIMVSDSTDESVCSDSQNQALSRSNDIAEEDAMINELMRLELGELTITGTVKSTPTPAFLTIGVTRECFVCGNPMKPLRPLYHCCSCPKAYHGECVGEREPGEGGVTPRVWKCPRHACDGCGSSQSEDGALFLCYECPSAFCFDCLDPRYLELDESGLQFAHIRCDYPGMEEEGMDRRRSTYYIRCRRCSGASCSSSSLSDDATEDEQEQDDNEDIGGGSDS